MYTHFFLFEQFYVSIFQSFSFWYVCMMIMVS